MPQLTTLYNGLNSREYYNALKKENIDLLRKVIEKQQTITKVRKVTFFLVIGSGAVGIFNPIVGGVSLVASVGVPLLWSAAQKRKWKALGNVYPGIEYLYSVSKDLSRESTQARLRVHVIVIWLLVAASTATYPRVRV